MIIAAYAARNWCWSMRSRSIKDADAALDEADFPPREGVDGIEPEPSKSAIKREHHALQELAEHLVRLPRRELESLALDAKTWEAIDETARIKDKRALGRHYKRIANCLAGTNPQPLQALLAEREQVARAASALHHQVERWRERLIGEGDVALADFLLDYPSVERQPLRALIRVAARDAERGRSDGPRKLFRYLRDLIQPR